MGGADTGKTAWEFLKKLKIEIQYGPAISPLGVYPQKIEKY